MESIFITAQLDHAHHAAGATRRASSLGDSNLRYAALRSVIITAVCALGWLTINLPAATAGTLAVVSCKDPVTDAAEPTDGWTAGWTGTAFTYAGNLNECAQGSALKSYVGAEVNQQGSTGPDWEYAPPEGDEVVGGEISAAFSIPGGAVSPYTGAAGITAPKLLFDGADLLEGTYSPAGGVAGSYEGVYRLAGHTGGHIWMYAFCEPAEATCPGNQSNSWYWALAEMRWADILLANDATPTAAGFSGAIATTTGPVSGTESLTFTAKEEGAGAPGIYTVKATLDGQSIYDATPNNNGGSCQALGANRFPGIYEFASPHPCPTNVSAVIPLNTTVVKDGSHELVVTVTDAAGNDSIVYTKQILTDNAPVALSEPLVTGSAQVDSALTGIPASFNAPEGTGSVSAISSQWLRCSNAAATQCAAIPGATTNTYVPNSSDIGYYIVYACTASDRDGTMTAHSQPTVAVTEPNKEVAGYGGQSNPVGQPGSSTSVGGSGGAGGSGGIGGLNVNLTSQNDELGNEKEPWKITLHASKVRVRRGGTVTFEGVVSTTPRPSSGKLVGLRARSVLTRKNHHRRKHTTYGKWVTFYFAYTNAAGQYKTTHTFKLRGTNVYQLQAIAPKEALYRNPTGVSSMVTVTERQLHRR